MKTKASKSEPTIEESVLCERVNRTARQLRNISERGFFPPPERGEYQLEATLFGLIKYFQQLGEQERGEMHQTLLDRAKDKARQERVDADKAEELVVNKADMQRTVTRFAMALKFKCIALCKKVSTRMALKSDPIEIEQDLLAEMRDIFQSVKFDYGFSECPNCKKTIEP